MTVSWKIWDCETPEIQLTFYETQVFQKAIRQPKYIIRENWFYSRTSVSKTWLSQIISLTLTIGYLEPPSQTIVYFPYDFKVVGFNRNWFVIFLSFVDCIWLTLDRWLYQWTKFPRMITNSNQEKFLLFLAINRGFYFMEALGGTVLIIKAIPQIILLFIARTRQCWW